MADRGNRKLKKITAEVHPEHPALFAPPVEISLNEQRNKLLIARYVYYITAHAHTERRSAPANYTEILALLKKDFFISTERLVEIIDANAQACKALREQNHPTAWYRAQWPNFAW